MESATILTPLAAVLCFPSEPNIPEGPEYCKISPLYRCTGRSFHSLVLRNDVKKPLRELNNFELQQQQNLGRIFGFSKMHLRPPVAFADVRSVLMQWFCSCLFVVDCYSRCGVRIVVRYFISILVLQSF